MTSGFTKKRLYNAIAFRFNKLKNSLNLPFTIQLNGKTFTIPLINTLGKANTSLGDDDWFVRLVKLLNLPADGDFLDVGVNVGQSLLLFRSTYDNTYWGFEPNPDCIFYLEHLVKINKLQNVNLLPAGLSSADAIVKLYARNDHDSAATIFNELKPGIFQSHHAKYVPVFSFESLQLDIKKIALIKIDVEGAELDVIAGMQETLRRHQPVIICEILDYTSEESREREQKRASELFTLLKALQYNAYRIMHKSKTKLEYEPIHTLELRKWVPESFDLNDYLFLPQNITTLPG